MKTEHWLTDYKSRNVSLFTSHRFHFTLGGLIYAVGHKYDWNRKDRKTARTDVPLAKVVHSAEEERLQKERYEFLERQRELAEADALVAKQVQDDEMKTVSVNQIRAEADELLARNAHEEEIQRANREYEEKARRASEDALIASRVQQQMAAGDSHLTTDQVIKQRKPLHGHRPYLTCSHAPRSSPRKSPRPSPPHSSSAELSFLLDDLQPAASANVAKGKKKKGGDDSYADLDDVNNFTPVQGQRRSSKKSQRNSGGGSASIDDKKKSNCKQQ
ncbi:hypothetical protein CAPTEDRAFT_201353 [Capitella teleta]|uniref:Coiled-coil domain-containing protein n=1 Tax=Capitella teleta TaxID=283909 RepID=R7V0R9_CAPTE|nr:hypothetical protein CAPTEDRAFT_201353 [Capitella teleta]|eukprot:ELU09812.1 hypothetical protein CAPTEDRAFT_201353 [Capitella teleta]